MGSEWSIKRRQRISDRIEFVYKYQRYDSEGRFVGRQLVDVVDKDKYQAYTVADHYQARATHIAIVVYQIDPPDKNDSRVPIFIARWGKAAIAVYLYGGVFWDAEGVCTMMDISEDTLKKYVRRLEKRFSD